MNKHLLRVMLVAGVMVAPVAFASPAAADPGRALRIHGQGQAFTGDFGFIDYQQGTYWEDVHVRGTVHGSLGKGTYYLVFLYRCVGYQPYGAHTRSCTESWRARIETNRGWITMQSETRPEAVQDPYAFEVTGAAGQFAESDGSGTAEVDYEVLEVTGRLASAR